MTTQEIKHLQRSMNRFVRDHKGLGHSPVIEDGEMGQLTRKLLRDIHYDLGYRRENIKDAPDEHFFKRMNHPNEVHNDWGQTKEVVRRGQERRTRRVISVRRHRIVAFLHPGVGTFDGKSVAKVAIPIMRWCREVGHDGEKWEGDLVSGWRDPKYSQSLCYRMCGRPSCPGRCAGLTSNHVGDTPTKFAIDVSDYARFARVVAHCPIKPHIHNSLGAQDPVHFSPSGN